MSISDRVQRYRAEVISRHYGGWDKIHKFHSVQDHNGHSVVIIDNTLRRILENDPMCQMPERNILKRWFGTFSLYRKEQ